MCVLISAKCLGAHARLCNIAAFGPECQDARLCCRLPGRPGQPAVFASPEQTPTGQTEVILIFFFLVSHQCPPEWDSFSMSNCHLSVPSQPTPAGSPLHGPLQPARLWDHHGGGGPPWRRRAGASKPQQALEFG